MLCLLGCNEKGEMYPSIITEFANLKADKDGVASSLTLDDGTSYGISNPVRNLTEDATYRVVCGFVPKGSVADIYTLTGAQILRDSTEIAHNDPTNIVSAWCSGKYVNMQLAPKGAGGKHYWGYAVDSVTTNHIHLSLHHNQNGDPASYSSTVYASLILDAIEGINEGDTITMSVNTFKGKKEWKVMY